MITKRTPLGNQKHGYWHPNQQKGWRSGESTVGYSRSGQLQDEDYYASLALHDPLWRYVISRYDKEIFDHQNTAVVNVLGYRALPVAIELSQWGYEINFLCQSEEERQKTKVDIEKQAGFLKENLFFDFTKNCPRGTVVCFIGVVDEFFRDEDMFSFLDTLLRRNLEVVFAVYNSKDWKRTLEDRYEVNVKPYPDQSVSLITLKAQALAFPSLQP